jgi:hypothetical protein
MPTNLSYGLFALQPEAVINDSYRDGTILKEYFEVNVPIVTNTGDVEVPTTLAEVLGVENLCYSSVFAAGDALANMTTDGVITAGAVTVRVNSVSIADGALKIRGFLVGKGKSQTIILNSPLD